MTEPTDILAPSIGACLSCRQLFLVSPDTPNCILCGRPPAYTLPFTDAHPELIEEPETPGEAPTGLISREEAIRHLEDLGFSREGAEKELGPEPPAPAAEEEAPAPEELSPGSVLPEEAKGLELVLEEIGQYLADSDWRGDSIAARLEDMGAEPEAAATAVGRLQAVRELLQQLTAAREPTPVAPAPPEAEDSPENT